MNTQIRKFYESDEIWGSSTEWFEYYKIVKKENIELKKQLEEKEVYIAELSPHFVLRNRKQKT